MEQLEQFYQALHQIPEIGYCERKTKKYIMDSLTNIDCVMEEVGDTALAVYFDKQKTQTIALRAEMDALPIREENEVSYVSKHKGYMHACGHDAHMAILLSVAVALSHNTLQTKYNIVLLFQSAEELNEGASQMVECGVLGKYKVEAVFALHVWPGLKRGSVYARDGVMLAGSDEVDIEISGESVHIAQKEKGHDALLAGADLLLTFHETMNHQRETLCYFGKMNGGTMRNVVASHCSIQGSLRFFELLGKEKTLLLLEEVAKEVDWHYGTHTVVNINDGNIPVVNSNALFHKLKQVIKLETCTTYYQAEDFGEYGKHCPIFFGLLGAGEETASLHSSHFMVDKAVLECGFAFYQQLLEFPLSLI